MYRYVRAGRVLSAIAESLIVMFESGNNRPLILRYTCYFHQKQKPEACQAGSGIRRPETESVSQGKKLEGLAGGRLAQSIYTSRSDSTPERNAKEGSGRNETQAVARRNKFDCEKRASGGKEAETLQCREHRRGQSDPTIWGRESLKQDTSKAQ